MRSNTRFVHEEVHVFPENRVALHEIFNPLDYFGIAHTPHSFQVRDSVVVAKL
jgi:hypothetical protein